MSSSRPKRKPVVIGEEDRDFITKWKPIQFAHAPAKDLRRFVSKWAKYLHTPPGGTMVWKKPPTDWPDGVPYRDPNNGTDRPKQLELGQMATLLCIELERKYEDSATQADCSKIEFTDIFERMQKKMTALIEQHGFVALRDLDTKNLTRLKILLSCDDGFMDQHFLEICEKLHDVERILDWMLLSNLDKTSFVTKSLERISNCAVFALNINERPAAGIANIAILETSSPPALEKKISTYMGTDRDNNAETNVKEIVLSNTMEIAAADVVLLKETLPQGDSEVLKPDANTQVLQISDHDEDLAHAQGPVDESVDETMQLIGIEPDVMLNHMLREFEELYQSESMAQASATAAESLDSLLNSQTSTTIGCEANTLVAQCGLEKAPSRPDGYCILHSWGIATGEDLNSVKRKIEEEFERNRPLYESHYIVNPTDLRSYLDSGNFSSDTVDCIPNMLVNASRRTAYLVQDNEDECTSNVTKIEPNDWSQLTIESEPVFMLKTGAHYDALVRR